MWLDFPYIVLLDKRIYLYSGMKKRFPCISLSAGVGLALLLKGKEIIKWSLHLMGSPRGVHFHDTIYERPPFFFIPDLTNGLSSTTFLYYSSFHFYWTSPLYNYYKKKICLNNKALPYSIIYLIYIILLPFIHPVRVRMLRPWSIYKFMNTSGNHLENVYTSLFFTIWVWTFYFLFYSHHLRGTKLCVPPPIRVEKTDFFFLCAYAAVGDVEVKKLKREKRKKKYAI